MVEKKGGEALSSYFKRRTAKGKPWRVTIRCHWIILGDGFQLPETSAAIRSALRFFSSPSWDWFFLPDAILTLRDAYRLEDASVTRTLLGQILKVHSCTSTGRRGGTTSHYIDYTYTVGAMAVRVRPCDISQDNWQALQGGDSSLMIKYLTADPVKISVIIKPTPNHGYTAFASRSARRAGSPAFMILAWALARS
jgi:hypothetical protein